VWHEKTVWDFSARNVKRWKECHPDTADRKIHVPVGYHQSMERFKKAPWNECKWDIVFTGAPCVRRHFVLDELSRRGLKVLQVPMALYGEGRDRCLAQSRLALNIQYYENGVHPALRTAHAVANRLPILSENAPEIPDWANLRGDYAELVDKAYNLVTRRREYLDHMAESAYLAFRMNPLTLPA
jgi:hypothetical protein